MPKTVVKTVVRAATAVATGGISEVVNAGKAAIKGDFTTALIGGAGGLGASSVAGAVANDQIETARMKKAAAVQAGQAVDGPPKDMAAAEVKVEQDTKLQERRRRQLLAQQGSLIKTSPLGAAIKDRAMLGGPKLTGY